MRLIIEQFEILELEIVNISDRGVELHAWQWARFASQLQPGLFEVVGVQVEIAKGMDEGSRLELANLGDHQGQERIRSDIERHTEEQIGAALIKLAAQFTVLNEKLKQSVAGRQGHLVQLAHVPGAHDQTPAVGFGFDLFDHLVDLINRASIPRAPVAPLSAVNPSQIAFAIRPLIPNRDAMLVEV